MKDISTDYLFNDVHMGAQHESVHYGMWSSSKSAFTYYANTRHDPQWRSERALARQAFGLATVSRQTYRGVALPAFSRVPKQNDTKGRRGDHVAGNALITPDNYGRAHCCAAFQEDTATTLTYNVLAAPSLSSPKIIRHQNGSVFSPLASLSLSLSLFFPLSVSFSPSLSLCLSRSPHQYSCQGTRETV